ncbi:MAG: hypothetical protein Q9183_007129 [Haloplaca sp. 2 TL-2023]
MAGPSYLESVDRILRARHAHYKGSLECGNWSIGNYGIQTTTIKHHGEMEQVHWSFQVAFMNALEMLAFDENSSFGLVLNTAIQRLEAVLSLDCATTWDTLTFIIPIALENGRVETAQSLFRCSAQLLDARSRQRHPLRYFVQNVARLLNETGSEQLWQAMKVVDQSNTDMLICLMGSNHWSVSEAQLDYIQQYGDLVSFDRDRATFEKLISGYENHYGSYHWQVYQLRLEFGEYLNHSVDRPEEAIEVFSYVIDHFQHRRPKDYASFLSELYSGRSNGHHKCGNIAMAETDLRRAIEFEETAFGQNSEWRLTYITRLELLQSEQGHEEAAAETRKERLRLFEHFKKEAEEEDKARFGRKL